MTFEDAFQRLIGHEGGYQANPKDRGNWTSGEVGKGVCKGTKYGISAMTYPGEDIEHLTLERAQVLYRRDFWGPAGCDLVPEGVRFDLFDMAVNSGVKRAVKTLQKALGEAEDGLIGPHTLQALRSVNPIRVVARFNGARLIFMAGLPTWDEFGEGWAKRLGSNLMEA